MSNSGDVLAQLHDAGLLVDQLRVDSGKPVRCMVEGGGREKRGWYLLRTWVAPNGEALIVGSFGVWHGDDNGARKVALPELDGKRREIDKDQRAALRRQYAEDRKRAEADRRREIERAARKAGTMWKRLAPDGESPYLAAKGVTGHGLRYTENGTAVVPMLDAAGSIHGLQFLRTPAQAKAGKRPVKEFWPAGLAKKGMFHLVGSPDWIVLVAEGYATAASLHAATGYPVAVAFDAGNLMPVAEALRKRYRFARILVCADDDRFGHCHQRGTDGAECRARIVLAEHVERCPTCKSPHRCKNAGADAASTAALAVAGSWLAPQFADPAELAAQFLGRGIKATDFNDLHQAEGLHLVRSQVEAKLGELRWERKPRALPPVQGGGEGGAKAPLRVIESLDELLERYALVYASNGAVFDRREHCLLPINDMRNACIRSSLHKAWMEHTEREIVRQEAVGFDPACDDPKITCNLWAGWPTEPKAGSCERMLDLLRYMCSNDPQPERLYQWILRWVAYPIQHPGAKMKSTVVLHGPQGAGKNLFFESVMAIYGQYGRILDQDALESQHNDWASRKLFMIADEVVASAHKFQTKNKLKTLITGTWIRINPKHIAAYDEGNHVNLVFLSNDSMPVVLEEDDRRHCVVWTPPKRGKDYYRGVMQDIGNGGIAALHHHLLHVDLGDFDPGTEPPLTDAKFNLIALAQDSPMEFADAVFDNDIPGVVALPGLTTTWYDIYRHWCAAGGVKPASLKRFLHEIAHRRAMPVERKRYWKSAQQCGPHSVLMWRMSAPEGSSDPEWLGERIETCQRRLKDLKGGVE